MSKIQKKIEKIIKNMHIVIKWNAVMPTHLQKEIFSNTVLRLVVDSKQFLDTKDIRVFAKITKSGNFGEETTLFIAVKMKKLENISKITQRFTKSIALGNDILWFFYDNHKLLTMFTNGEKAVNIETSMIKDVINGS